jgi:hypothetical protein
MKKLLLILTLFSQLALAAPILRIAVIDTGVNRPERFNICKDGLVDLTDTSTHDFVGHGTNIITLIQKFAQTDKSLYCFDVIKYYVKRDAKTENGVRFQKAIDLAIKRGAHIISAASNGFTYSTTEHKSIKDFTFKDGTVRALYIAPAGNDGIKLNPKYNDGMQLINGTCDSFPACYMIPGVIVAGNGISSREPASSSNSGKAVDIWVNGNSHEVDRLSMSGTSQSTAIVTGMVIALVARASLSATNPKEYDDAVRKSMEAVYFESGADVITDNYVQILKKDSPEFLRKVLTIIYPTLYTIRQGQVTYRWDF